MIAKLLRLISVLVMVGGLAVACSISPQITPSQEVGPKTSPLLDLSPTQEIYPSPQTSPSPDEGTGMANPASVNCIAQGGKLEIRTDNTGGQYGMCLFPDGSECEEWALFRGECNPGQSNQGQGPLPPPRYINEKYGFMIDPPIEWSIATSDDHRVILVNNGFYLFIGNRWVDEEMEPFRTGMPAGDFVDSGTYTLIGQAVPRQYLIFEGKIKLVYYAGAMEVGKLRLGIWLDTREGDYKTIDIPVEMIAKADAVLATFAFSSGETPTIIFP
jgi:putative hemolysin